MRAPTDHCKGVHEAGTGQAPSCGTISWPVGSKQIIPLASPQNERTPVRPAVSGVAVYAYVAYELGR